jgi:hypothetical protein
MADYSCLYIFFVHFFCKVEESENVKHENGDSKSGEEKGKEKEKEKEKDKHRDGSRDRSKERSSRRDRSRYSNLKLFFAICQQKNQNPTHFPS